MGRGKVRSKRRRWAGLGTGALALAVVVAFAIGIAMSPVGRRLLFKLQTAVMQMHREVRAALKLPLPGTPDLTNFDGRLAGKGLELGAPVFIRIFKHEHQLEVWMAKGPRFELFATYPICYFSGDLGPKVHEGDRQAVEGFYTILPGQLNPHSRHHRAFNLGYPNPYDKAHHRTGKYLMVHGGCSSIGCYAVTDPAVDEIWRVVKAAFDHGQKRFHVQAFPFRMTDSNIAAFPDNHWTQFWHDLKAGYDAFEANHIPPRVSLCNKRYVVEKGAPGDIGNLPILERCPATASTN